MGKTKDVDRAVDEYINWLGKTIPHSEKRVCPICSYKMSKWSYERARKHMANEHVDRSVRDKFKQRTQVSAQSRKPAKPASVSRFERTEDAVDAYIDWIGKTVSHEQKRTCPLCQHRLSSWSYEKARDHLAKKHVKEEHRVDFRTRGRVLAKARKPSKETSSSKSSAPVAPAAAPSASTVRPAGPSKELAIRTNTAPPPPIPTSKELVVRSNTGSAPPVVEDTSKALVRRNNVDALVPSGNR